MKNILKKSLFIILFTFLPITVFPKEANDVPEQWWNTKENMEDVSFWVECFMKDGSYVIIYKKEEYIYIPKTIITEIKVTKNSLYINNKEYPLKSFNVGWLESKKALVISGK